MEIFKLTVTVMFMMFSLIIVGFILRKKEILPKNADATMARLETYALVPALNFYNWSSNCSINSLKENAILIFYGMMIVLPAALISYPLSRIFVPGTSLSAELNYQKNIYKYALTFGNYAFLGNFVILGVFGSEGLFKYSMFTLGLSFCLYSWGFYILVPQDKKPSPKELVKKIFNPPIIGLLLGGIIGLLGLTKYMPTFIGKALSNASNCMGPIAMILAGFVMGGYNLKELFGKKKIYFVTLLRLVIIPVTALVVLRLLGVENELTLTFVIVAFGAPLGLNTIVYPAAYGGETKTGASMAMVSHLLSLISIPILYYTFIILL